MRLDQLVYKPGKELIGYQDGKYMYTINGVVYAKVKDNFVFAKDGSYIGEFNFAHYLVRKKRDLVIDPYNLPANQEKLPRKMMMVGITQKLGALAKPYHGGSSGEFWEYPNTEDLEKLH